MDCHGRPQELSTISWGADTEVTNRNGDIVAAYDVLTMVATDAEWARIGYNNTDNTR